LLAWVAYKSVVRNRSTTKLAHAIHIHEEVLREFPTSAPTHYNLADLYWMAARLEEAMAGYEAALKLAPRLRGAHTRVAYCLLGLGDVQRAKARLEVACRAPTLTPTEEMFKCEAHLLLGHMREGWRRCDLLARHQSNPRTVAFTRHVRGPLWDGNRLEGALLIGGCDGYGDVIMAARYIPGARQRVRSLTMCVADALVPLLRGQSQTSRCADTAAFPIRASSTPGPRF
jgi:hypothetical protein